MKLSQRGLDLICEFEGYHTALPDGSCKAYLDRLAKPPVWTIGYGCTEGVTAGMVLTKNEARELFARELAKHEAIVMRLVTVAIGQNNFDALVSFSYNTGGLAKSTLLRKLNRGDFAGAAREFAKWNKAGGTVYKGLVRRRAAEMALFEADARDEHIPQGEPDMPQKVDEPTTPAAPVAAGSLTGAIGGNLLLGDPVGLTSAAVALKGNAGQLMTGIDLTTWIVPLVILSAVLGVIFYARRQA